MVLFLGADEADFITGSTLSVNCEEINHVFGRARSALSFRFVAGQAIIAQLSSRTSAEGPCGMKRTIYALSLLLAIGSGPALATNCMVSGGYAQLSGTQISSLLEGRTACYPAGGPPWTNQEAHSGGTITDFKQGTNPVDPSGPVGTYTISSGDPGTITYNYSSGPSFSYTVFGSNSANAGTYDFCVGATPLAGRVEVENGTGHGC